MKTFHTVLKLAQPDVFIAKLDIKEAYYRISAKEEDKPH